MIVTFHLAVYFAYHLWEKYVSILFTSDGNGPGTNENARNNGNTLNSSTENISSNENDMTENEPNLTFRAAEITEMKKSNTRQVQEGDGDILDVNHADEGVEAIYNVEPKYECHVDPEENGMRFIPPVYTQRYMIIEKILKEPCWVGSSKKVVDFGCAELSFELKHLKKLFGIEEIVSVDIDSNTLSYYHCKMKPTVTDHLDPRPSPLTVRIFCGSVAHTNEVLASADAVIAIELIEHLYPPELDCLPFTVFGFIKPKIAMFTTPNADFNVLFHNFSGFRHYDHKFEWSRQQFEDWALNLVLRYPEYSVTFQGVGPGPTGSEHLGCCSQMATFVKDCESEPVDEEDIHVQDGPYELIEKYTYPYFVDKRSLEEKLRDDAVSFISRWKMLSKFHDEEPCKEIPLKSIMERLKFFRREKLKDILTKDNWEVGTNENGYEVVVVPYSDSEEDNDLCSNHSEDNSDPAHSQQVVNPDKTQIDEEVWGSEEWESSVNVNCPTGKVSGQAISDPSTSFVSPKTTNVECAQTDKTTNNDLLVYCPIEKCYQRDEFVPDSSVVSDSFNYSEKDNSSTKCPDLDCSVYKTPFNYGCTVKKSNCETLKSSVQSGYQNESSIINGCNRALSFETPDIYKNHDSDNIFSTSDLKTVHNEINSSCCVTSVHSPFDTSTYATPCCSQLHKKYIPKCLSLQQIAARSGSPVFATELESSSRGCSFIGEQKDKMSKSMDGFKSQESCDMHETCSNTSRVVDSGYPDSYSEHNMDMDLTPEQFDDIETESEGDVSSRSLSPPPPPPPPLAPRRVDAVENGDVANNNRDGEGNNMVADMEEEPLEFEAQIEEVNNEVANFAAVDYLDHRYAQFWNRPITPEVDDVSSSHFCALPKLRKAENWSTPQNTEKPEDSVFKTHLEENKAISESSLGRSLGLASDEQDVKAMKSDSTIVTSSSWSHLDSVESQHYFDVQESTNDNSKSEPKKIKSCDSLSTVLDERLKCADYLLVEPVKPESDRLKPYDSLTTVLDGCSKYSDCSLVHPIDTGNVCCKQIEQDSNSDNNFPKWMLKIDIIEEGDYSKETKVSHPSSSFSSTQNYSLVSSSRVNQSVGSFNNTMLDGDYESSTFPQWLLDIELSEDENDLDSRVSVETVWDTDSLDELVGFNFDVQVDSRGGGDPQSETWN